MPPCGRVSDCIRCSRRRILRPRLESQERWCLGVTYWNRGAWPFPPRRLVTYCDKSNFDLRRLGIAIGAVAICQTSSFSHSSRLASFADGPRTRQAH